MPDLPHTSATTSPMQALPQPAPATELALNGGIATVRGDIAVTTCMEQLQNGYLRSVAAAAGCAIAKPEPDAHGTDWNVFHESSHHSPDPVAQVWVQLKSTSQVDFARTLGRQQFSIRLENAHLRKLNRSPVTFARLLVVMLVPRNMDDWIKITGPALEIRHPSFWVNLEGKPVTGRTKTTVHVPTRNIFDDIGLCRIMKLAGSGQKPL